jgi:hypothetical protein
MLLTAQKGNVRLPSQGIHAAELHSVTYKNENKNIGLDFKLDGADDIASKIAPMSLTTGPLKGDMETLNGRPFSDAELEAGIEPENLIGKKCQAVVVHKKTSGKKLVAVVSVIMPPVAKVAPGAADTEGTATT